MANYKRGYCRYRRFKPARGSTTAWRAKHGLKPVVINYNDYSSTNRHEYEWRSLWPKHINMMWSYPAAHDVLYHSRPHRRNTRLLEWEIMRGVDPDDLAWPLRRKPHVCYW